MHGQERRRLATGTLVKFDHSYADTIAELGYPTRSALRAWRDEHERTGEVPTSRLATNPKHAAETGRRAVEHYPGHGKSLARTTGALGYPKSRERPSERADELAPGRRRHRGPGPGREATPPRGEGAGRRRARGEGRVRRGDGRATRRVENGTLPLAQGDDGRQWRGTRGEGRARGQGVRRPARRCRGVAGRAARGEDAAREGAAGAGRPPGDPRDSKKRPGRRPGAAGRRGEGGDGDGAGGQARALLSKRNESCW